MGGGRRLRLALPLLAWAGTTNAAAQASRIQIGAEVGFASSDLTGSDVTQQRHRRGALTGVYLAIPMAGPVSLRQELLFMLKGGRATAPSLLGGTTTLDLEMGYIEMPLVARVALPTGQVRPTLFGGAAPAVQIGCSVQPNLTGPSARTTCSDVNVASLRSFDVGLVAGGGFEIRWPQSSLSVEFRYTRGRRSILRDLDIRNRTLGLALGLSF